jgi:hypothetical protein
MVRMLMRLLAPMFRQPAAHPRHASLAHAEYDPVRRRFEEECG